ncbi:hypothetical protein MITS9504_00193 [Synechococcus sp. MIT S9504]|nr:hypothetical protein MITS9504_00193 [Synechococcus sp. MIT S9504]
MCRGAVEKNRGFPQFLDAFPLLLAQSGRLEDGPVVLGSGAFGCLTGGLLRRLEWRDESVLRADRLRCNESCLRSVFGGSALFALTIRALVWLPVGGNRTQKRGWIAITWSAAWSRSRPPHQSVNQPA